MPVKSLKIVKRGSISWDAFEEPDARTMAMKRLAGIGGGSTVTYVESDVRILIDTGFDNENDQRPENVERNHRELMHALDYFALKPSDIDIVFITHWHYDHFGNLGLFKNSRIMARRPMEGFEVKSVNDGEVIADGVRVVYTPGHTMDHASLVLQTERLRHHMRSQYGGSITGIGCRNIAVAGDAIVTAPYYLTNKLWTYNSDFYSLDKGHESMRRLGQHADFIVPGHGSIFQNVKKNSVTKRDETAV